MDGFADCVFCVIIPRGKNVLGGGVIDSLKGGVIDGDGNVSCFSSSESDSLINQLQSI